MSSPVRVVAFDAVGTLIYATPSVSSAYCSVLRDRCGIEVDPSRVRDVLNSRLSKRMDEPDLRTSEEQERAFWFDLISELVREHEQQEPAFHALFEHFATAQSWCCFDDVAKTLAILHREGVRLLLASNFDHRLHAVKHGLRELDLIEHTIVSSEVGWRKPSRAFFQHVCHVAQCEPHEILFVGDDIHADVYGAQTSGLHAMWLDRSSPRNAPFPNSRIQRCESLQDLLASPLLDGRCRHELR